MKILPARRVAAHVVVLSVIGGLALAGGVAAKSSSQQAVDIEQQEPAQPAPAMLPLDVAPTPQARTQGADQTTAAGIIPPPSGFNPRLGLPKWLRTTRETPLWSNAETGAEQVELLSPGQSYLRPLGTIDGDRVGVYVPMDGKQGWVDVVAVEPSGIPGWVGTSTAESSALLAQPPLKVSDAAAPNVSALYVAVVDDDSGRLLYGQQPHVSVPQASTTKIATTLVALERERDLNRRIKVS
ncbi:MAG TPA: hypothetical protein VFG86_08385, partial [Chloroflexota bacterium]|nr:hypothetical protein [Chloroflexota bacterium]